MARGRPHNFEDLTARSFGRWLVQRYAGKRKWICLCVCGNTKAVYTSNLTQGLSVSCGCYLIDRIVSTKTTHGRNRTPEHRAWCSMKGRCYDAKNKRYARYGGRGIRVCERWLNSFQAFFDDVGPKPSPKHQLDRINNDGHYELGNVRWATTTEQSRNRSNTIFLELDGQTLSLGEWAEKMSIAHSILANRVAKGWSAVRTLTQPVRKSSPRTKSN